MVHGEANEILGRKGRAMIWANLGDGVEWRSEVSLGSSADQSGKLSITSFHCMGSVSMP